MPHNHQQHKHTALGNTSGLCCKYSDHFSADRKQTDHRVITADSKPSLAMSSHIDMSSLTLSFVLPDEKPAAEEEPRDSLCSCLMLAAPLASAVVSLQSQLLPAEDSAQRNATDRLAYPALSALVTACQIKTAVAIQGSAQTDELCSADAFEPFWSPAAAW